jgi:hypothetical protein
VGDAWLRLEVHRDVVSGSGKTIFCYIIKSPEISEAKIMLVSGDFYLIIVSPEIENEIINLVIY